MLNSSVYIPPSFVVAFIQKALYEGCIIDLLISWYR